MIQTPFVFKEFRVKLYVQNFSNMLDFYQEVLGFSLIKQWDRGEKDKGVMFQVGNGILELLTPEKEYLLIQGCDVSIEVDDVHKLWVSLKERVSIVFPLRDNQLGDTSFCIADPEGFQLTFFTINSETDQNHK